MFPHTQCAVIKRAYESDYLTQFDDLGLAEPILRAVTAEGYTIPTPIQEKTIPALRRGSDVLGIAQTGTGKTAAFVLPLLDRLISDQRPAGPGYCRALILAPTRELAGQIADSIRGFSRHTRLRTALIVGGVKAGPQIKSLQKGVDVVVATPGRLEDHLVSGAIRLDRTAMIVLDEADQMLDLGFLPAIRRIMAKLRSKRQTVMFSATMPKPVRALARDFQTDYQEISVSPAARPVDLIDQRVISVGDSGKLAILVNLLRDPNVKRAVVFTRTKRGADRLSKKLGHVGLASVAIHGNKSQGQRIQALNRFKAGKTPILIATDIAARGIDIDDVSHVVNYELPNVPEAYVHRIGRTARAGKTGTAISLCDSAELGLLRDIEKLIGRRLLGGAGGEDKAPERAPKRRPRRRKDPSFRRGKKAQPERVACPLGA